MLVDPTAAGEVIEILTRIHGSVHRAYHSRRYRNTIEFIVKPPYISAKQIILALHFKIDN